MIYYDESGNLLENPDMTAGYLEPREVIYYEAVEVVHLLRMFWEHISRVYTLFK